jgi:hypothetical protein
MADISKGQPVVSAEAGPVPVSTGSDITLSVRRSRRAAPREECARYYLGGLAPGYAVVGAEVRTALLIAWLFHAAAWIPTHDTPHRKSLYPEVEGAGGGHVGEGLGSGHVGEACRVRNDLG